MIGRVQALRAIELGVILTVLGLTLESPPVALGRRVVASAVQPRASIEQRLAAREYPSVFQAWAKIDNLPDEDRWESAARHDLIWNWPENFGLRWNGSTRLLSADFQPRSLIIALATRNLLVSYNPNIILVAQLDYRDYPGDGMETDHPWWQRDAVGNRILGWEEGGWYLLDWRNPELRRHVANQARALIESGVVDGIMLDWWDDTDPDRVSLVREVRGAIGPDGLIIVNSNWNRTPNAAPYVNGLFMETTIPSTGNESEEWQRAADALRWAETSLRSPRVNAFETWSCSGAPPHSVPCTETSRRQLNRMRATTALVLTHSNGFALFADPNGLPTPDHLHSWYPFWNKTLGKPQGEGTLRPDGAHQREFDNGSVVYNPIGNARVEVRFPQNRRSAANGRVSTTFLVDPLDGDLFLKAS